jgi:hypothetical protein
MRNHFSSIIYAEKLRRGFKTSELQTRSRVALRVLILRNAVIREKQSILVVGAAFSRDHLISRLEAAPTGSLWQLGLYG